MNPLDTEWPERASDDDYTPYVIVEVRGGVAYITDAPPGITVVVRDYDNCEHCDPEADNPFDGCPDYCITDGDQ